MPQKFNILIQFDEQYRQSIVLIKNIMVNSDITRIMFHIFHATKMDLDFQINWLRENKINYKIYQIELDYINFFKLDKNKYPHITDATFFKLLISEKIDHDVHSILYLDLDIFIVGDILDIFDELDSQNPIIVAEENAGFNAGVILYNLDLYRTILTFNEIINLMKDFKFASDNDFLEYVFAQNHKKISPVWNFKVQSVLMEGLPRIVFKEKINQARIIHFVGTTKPWRYSTNLPYSDEWRKLYFSIYGNYPWESVTIKERLIKVLYKIFPNPRLLIRFHIFLKTLV
jgi:lipopolysaccharide biosynthesis glycosyltransferase